MSLLGAVSNSKTSSKSILASKVSPKELDKVAV
jgi:hypothetical protein